jgi:predicted MFS family arabinose efflux permease
MQSVAAAWLMTSLTTSPVPVALLTTMGSLPIFLVGLPAGALADVVDRRWLVLMTQVWMLIVAAVLSGLTAMSWMSPTLLLALTFTLALGGALSAPAWQAIVPQLVSRRQLAAAVALNSAGFNLARAVGPALGGLLVAAAGPAAVFILNALSFLGIMIVIYRWKPAPRDPGAVPERVGSAVAAGIRFTRHSPPLRAVLVRTAAFIFAGSALWALLPVVATQQLGQSALGYGIMLGSIGLGAVGGAAIMPRMRERLSPDQIVTVLTLVFAAGTLGLAYISNFLLLNIVLVAVGLAWLTITSSLNVTAQTTVPAWVMARALGVYLLVFQGGFAGGSAVWGIVAEQFGNRAALVVAAVMLVAGVVTALRWHLLSDDDVDLRPSQHRSPPQLENQPNIEEGPVLVTVEYRVPERHHEAFQQAMQEMQVIRLRDGATRWGLFHDAAQANRFLETFIVPSWGEHLRQLERSTVADKIIEEQAFKLQEPGTSPAMAHFISTQSVRPRQPEA